MKRDLENQIRGLLKNLGLIIATARGQAFHARSPRLRMGLLSSLLSAPGIRRETREVRDRAAR